MKSNLSNLKPLIVILGPTASGKTALSIALAKNFNGEIVSADSRQIYRGMDIGTAKPPRNEKLKMKNEKFDCVIIETIPHYMIDICDPDEEFTLQHYKQTAIGIIKDIQSRGKLPFLVGGTGLYISAVVDNLEIPEVSPNQALRQKLETKSNKELFQDLKRVDPLSAETIDRNNKRRLVRALEVCIVTGRPFSSQRNKGKPLFDALQIGISFPKEELYKKIDERVDEQFETGLEDEVKGLKEKYGCRVPAMSGIGYHEMCEYSEGKFTFEEAVRKIKSNTKKYAKRQMVWFKRDPRIHWITKQSEAEKLIKAFLKENKNHLDK